MARKIYTKEFKELAVKLSYVSGKSIAETASDLGLPVNMLHRWRREDKLTGLGDKPVGYSVVQLIKPCPSLPLSDTLF